VADRFDHEALQAALTEFGRRCHQSGRIVEIAIYGGSAIMLTMQFREATRDVDAVFDQDRDFVRKIAAGMAADFGWDEGWLNDGVKGFLSGVDSDSKVLLRTYPSEDAPGLRVFVPKPEYLFAMKCAAMRIGGVEASSDVEDIRKIAELLGIKDSKQALGIVESFYPARLLKPATRFGLEEIFSSGAEEPDGPNGPSGDRPP
jgi:hypothetical protein